MKTPRRTSTSHARQRGSVLVLVLGVTSIVGVIGLSSLLAVRLQHRDVQSRADAAQAQQLADGALQLIHTRLSEDPDWRTNHTHDTWTADEIISEGSTLRYKLQDPGDTDLADNETDPARLVVRVAHGKAVRLASIELAGAANLGPELVTNGDMESGATAYSITDLSGYLYASTVAPHSGNMNMIFQGRATSLDGWKQDLPPGAIESGKTYRLSVWIRLEDADADVILGLHNKLGSASDTEEQQTAATTNWQQIQFDLTPSFSFDPSSTYVFGRTASDIQDIHFDDLSLHEVSSSSDPLPVVRGSYRRELDN